MSNERKKSEDLEKLIDHISRGICLEEFFNEFEIMNLKQIEGIKRYEISEDRKGIILNAQENCFIDDKCYTNTTQVLIDIKKGEPTVHQVYDAIYGFGADCDLKIIICTNINNSEDEEIPSADRYAVLPLIAQLQKNNLPIVLFELDESSGQGTYIDFYQDWHIVNRHKKSSIPSKEQFMAETFWTVYFDYLNQAFYEPWSAFDGGFRDTTEWGYVVYIDCSMNGEIQIYWDERGLKYKIKQTDDSDNYLKSYYDKEQSNLQEKYGKDALTLEYQMGRLPRLHVKVSEKPFSWIYSATSEEIMKFAAKIWNDVWKLRWNIEEVLDKIYFDEVA